MRTEREIGVSFDSHKYRMRFDCVIFVHSKSELCVMIYLYFPRCETCKQKKIDFIFPSVRAI